MSSIIAYMEGNTSMIRTVDVSMPKTILVTSGIDNERTIREKGIEPDLVVSGLDVLVDLWEKQDT